jgi:hypothetical protein
VYGRDRGLYRVRAGAGPAQGGTEQVAALGDAVRVPQAPVLVFKRDQLSVRIGAGRAAGVDQQQQGQQAAHLGFGGQQPVQDPGQPDGFVGEVGPQ